MTNNAFLETKKLFIAHTGYTHPLSYEDWVNVPDDNKAAVLYVQFYDQITLAWYKTKSFFVLEEDGVATMLQYLVKNVPLILDNPNKFTPSYIYRVAYNCLYCISHDIKRDIDRYEKEMSNIVEHGEDTLDLFDTVSGSDNGDFDDVLMRKAFWETIENMDMKTQKVVNHLLNGTPLKKSTVTPLAREDADIMSDPDRIQAALDSIVDDDIKKQKEKRAQRLNRMKANQIKVNNYNIDPYKEVEVSLEEAERIISELRIKLSRFKEYYNM